MSPRPRVAVQKPKVIKKTDKNELGYLPFGHKSLKTTVNLRTFKETNMMNINRNIKTPNSSLKLPKIASPDPFPKINPVCFPIGILESVAYAFFR